MESSLKLRRIALESASPADVVVSQATFSRWRRELRMTDTAIVWVRARDGLAVAGLILFIFGLQACKTYRVAPDEGDARINDSGAAGSAVDGATDKSTVNNPLDANTDVGGQSPDVGTVCGSGKHICTGQCVSNTDVANCGMACVACPVPMGGSATCDGTSCGGSCPTGFKLCAGQCIAAAASCSGVCSAGTHDCSGNCQPSASPNSCGTSCTPCAAPAHGTPTCDGTTCGFTCDSRVSRLWVDLCKQHIGRVVRLVLRRVHRTDQWRNRDLRRNHLRRDLPVGDEALRRSLHRHQRVVLGRVSQRKPRLLGDVPAQHQPQLVRSILVYAVRDTHERCSDLRRNRLRIYLQYRLSRVRQLVPGEQQPDDMRDHLHDPVHGTGKRDRDLQRNVVRIRVQFGIPPVRLDVRIQHRVANCGTTSCTACTPPANSTATCDGNACGFTCGTGFHACGTACVANTSVSGCGTSCTACPVPTGGGTATCDGTSCGGTCPSGTKLCAGACIASSASCAGVCPAVRTIAREPASRTPASAAAEQHRARLARRPRTPPRPATAPSAASPATPASTCAGRRASRTAAPPAAAPRRARLARPPPTRPRPVTERRAGSPAAPAFTSARAPAPPTPASPPAERFAHHARRRRMRPRPATRRDVRVHLQRGLPSVRNGVRLEHQRQQLRQHVHRVPGARQRRRHLRWNQLWQHLWQQPHRLLECMREPDDRSHELRRLRPQLLRRCVQQRNLSAHHACESHDFVPSGRFGSK